MVDTPQNTNVVTPPVGHTPTISSTTSVVSPAAGASQRSPYLEWDGVVFVMGGLLAFFFLVKNVVEGVKTIFDFIDGRKKKNKEDNAPFESRLIAVEEAQKTFRSKDDLDERFQAIHNKIEHERDNRRMAQEGLDTKIRNIGDQQQRDRLALAEVKAKVDTVVVSNERLERSVDSLRERVDERFDRLHDAIVAKPK